MLNGEYNVFLGEKNRIAIPKRIRLNLSDNLFLTRGFENSLMLIDKERLNKILKVLETEGILSLNSRNFKRFLIGGIFEIKLDNQGRFVIPEVLLEFAKIEKEVCIIGVDDWVEIWNKENWLVYKSEIKDSLKNISENINDKTNKTYNSI